MYSPNSGQPCYFERFLTSQNLLKCLADLGIDGTVTSADLQDTTK